MPDGPTKRKIIITIENDVVGDELWVPSVACDLRALATLIENDTAFDAHVEFYNPVTWNRLTIWVGTRWKQWIIGQGA